MKDPKEDTLWAHITILQILNTLSNFSKNSYL